MLHIVYRHPAVKSWGIAALLVAGACWAEPADMVITGARIYTVDSRRPLASALAVKNGRIVYVGEDASKYLGAGVRHIEARGAAILPGLIDSHVHMEALGDELETFDFRDVRSVAEICELVRKEAARRKPGEWIRGRSWDQTNWGGQFPTADDLTRAAPDHPVYLTRVDGHAAWVNRKALEIAGVTANTPDPPGGKILRTPSGEPAGILIDNAEGLVASKIPPATPEDTRRRIARAAKECARLGLTTVHDAGVSPQALAAYRELIARHELPVRVYAMIGGQGPLWREYLKRGPEIGERLTVRSIKLMFDGALGSRGAALKEPYSDDPGNTGLTMLTKEQVERVAREAAGRGFQVNTHAIGDRANRMVLDAYGAALGGRNDRRFRIEHAQVVAPGDFDLFEKYSVVPSMQATHATSDMRWAEKRLGPERVKGAYAWRRFLSLGLQIPNGSDFPVEEPNPLLGFYAAITRQDPAGDPPGGWFPDQRMMREEALKSWTLSGAWAAFEERDKGSIEPGKLADFVMLSADIMRVPPREILKARVTMTVLGGEVVHSEGR
jgi:predicted amidohydrolase YtcJ